MRLIFFFPQKLKHCVTQVRITLELEVFTRQKRRGRDLTLILLLHLSFLMRQAPIYFFLSIAVNGNNGIPKAKLAAIFYEEERYLYRSLLLLLLESRFDFFWLPFFLLQSPFGDVRVGIEKGQ